MRWGPYKIVWEHKKDGKVIKTFCFIADTSFVEPIVLTSGTCWTSKTEETGRKVSLARALKKWQLSKDARTEVWQAYREMRGGKW